MKVQQSFLTGIKQALFFLFLSLPFQVSTQHEAFFRHLDVMCSSHLRLSRAQRC